MKRTRFLLVQLLAVAAALACGQPARSAVIYVAPSGNDGNPGTSWAAAKATPGGAIAAASAGDEVWVAAGTYADTHVAIPAGVTIYGGFAGDEPTRENRNPALHETILDGGGTGAVVTLAASAAAGQGVDGFTIRNGHVGVLATDSAGLISGNIIRDNVGGLFGTLQGAGIYVSGGNPVIRNNTIAHNHSGHDGGGVYAQVSRVTVADNVVEGNTSDRNGGGISFYECTEVVVTGNTVRGNECANNAAGGVSVFNSGVSGTAVVEGNTLEGCRAFGPYGAGGLLVWGVAAEVRGNRIAGNTARSGGGIYLAYGTVVLEENVIEENSATETGAGGLTSIEVASLVLSRNTLRGNQGVDWGGAVVAGKDALIEDNLIESNEGGAWGGGMHISGVALTMQRNRFVRNTAHQNGGGAEVSGCPSFLIANNLFDGNRGVYNCALTVAFTDNAADWPSRNRVINNTFVNNQTIVATGGTTLGLYQGVAVIANNILASNPAGGIYSNPGGISLPNSAVLNNNLFDSIWGFAGAVDDGGGNLVVDPLFANAAASDYHLQDTSQCLDAGATAAASGDWTDLDGAARVQNGAVDMGCYESALARDDTPPATTASRTPAPNAAGWNKANVTVSLSAADEGTGVQDIQYSLDGGTTYTRVDAASASLIIGSEGTTTVLFFAEDRAGNREALQSLTIMLDKTRPVTTASVVGATVTLSATDNRSGVKATWYKLDGATQKKYTAPFTVSNGAKHTIEFWSVDVAGNVEIHKKATVDLRTPTTLTVPDRSGTTGTAVTLQATLTRTSDGVPLAGKTVTFKIDTTTLGTATTDASGVAVRSYTIPSGLAKGSHAIKAIFAGTAALKPSTGAGTLTKS